MTRARDLADGADKDIAGTLTLDDIVLSNDMSVADNGKVQFGAGNDLQIFHNASASYITDQGTGNLVFGGDAAILLQNSAHSANMLDAYNGGRVGLYHNGTLKAATTSTGVDITGSVTVSNDGALFFGDTSTYISGSGAADRLKFITNGSEAVRIDSSQRVGIGTSSPTKPLTVVGGDFSTVLLDTANASHATQILFQANGAANSGADIQMSDAGGLKIRTLAVEPLSFHTAASAGTSTERMRIDSSGNVGIGVSSPGRFVHLEDGADTTLHLTTSSTGSTGSDGTSLFVDGTAASLWQRENDYLRFATNNTERMRIDNGGNVLVNQTSTSSPGFSNTTTGLCFSDSGRVFSSASGAASSFNRNTSDGGVIHIRKAGTLVGVLSVTDSDNFSLDCQTSSHSGITFGTANVIPRVNGANNDGNVDLGLGDKRWQNIYATNNAIQTSDETEKQNIASLTNAEITAAKAISKLFKTFKWKHRVSEEGDAARTHSGVIAQEVQTAMTDAGLDAADYAFWCSDTWWETSTDVPAVEADEEAGVEAKDAYTRIDTYYTADEAPEGATKRTRLGVRYAELMSFVGAATEQRLADIETRLTALEAAT